MRWALEVYVLMLVPSCNIHIAVRINYLLSSVLPCIARIVLSFSSFSSSVVILLAKIIVLPSSSLSSAVKRIAYTECLNVWLTESSSCGNLRTNSLKGITEPKLSMSSLVTLALFHSILFTFTNIELSHPSVYVPYYGAGSLKEFKLTIKLGLNHFKQAQEKF